MFVLNSLLSNSVAGAKIVQRVIIAILGKLICINLPYFCKKTI